MTNSRPSNSASAWAAFNLNSGKASVPLNTWTHVVAVWDGTAPKLFVNGVDTGAVATGPGGYNVNTSASFSVAIASSLCIQRNSSSYHSR